MIDDSILDLELVSGELDEEEEAEAAALDDDLAEQQTGQRYLGQRGGFYDPDSLDLLDPAYDDEAG